MATYSSPSYEYGQATNRLALEKSQSDAYQDYGRVLGQQRHRRNIEDMGRQFSQNFPRVGSSYNRRGMWNSGLRRQGQRDYAQDYNRSVQRANTDQAQEAQYFQLNRGISDASYQNALLNLYEQYQAARATGYDPFAAIRGG